MLEINAARVIQAITNITLDLSEEVEEVDMCKAIDDMMQDSREEGKAEQNRRYSVCTYRACSGWSSEHKGCSFSGEYDRKCI